MEKQRILPEEFRFEFNRMSLLIKKNQTFQRADELEGISRNMLILSLTRLQFYRKYCTEPPMANRLSGAHESAI